MPQVLLLFNNLSNDPFLFLKSYSFSLLSRLLSSTVPSVRSRSLTMQVTIALLTAVLALTVTAAPQAATAAPPDAATIASLVPEFGVTAGQSPNGSGDCVTPIAKPLIKCDCPPPRDQYLAQVTAAVQAGNTFGLPAPFPTGNDKQSQIVRLQTLLSVMQNVKGAKGVGCPAIATTYKKTLDGLTGAPPAPNAG